MVIVETFEEMFQKYLMPFISEIYIRSPVHYTDYIPMYLIYVNSNWDVCLARVRSKHFALWE
jgi:hypothetical protein